MNLTTIKARQYNRNTGKCVLRRYFFCCYLSIGYGDHKRLHFEVLVYPGLSYTDVNPAANVKILLLAGYVCRHILNRCSVILPLCVSSGKL